jgi:PAS domain S-box-containing protein
LANDRHHQSLSLREKQLIELAARGLTDAEMARDLGIAVGTVATYWGRIRSKYGGCSRTELVATALKESYEDTVDQLRARASELTSQLRTSTGEIGEGANFYQAVIETAPEAILTISPEGTIESINAASEELFGYERSELEGRPLSVLLPERYRKIHAMHIAEYFEHPARRKMGEHLATPARHKSGREFGIVASLSYVEIPDGLIVTCFVQPAADLQLARSSGRPWSAG